MKSVRFEVAEILFLTFSVSYLCSSCSSRNNNTALVHLFFVFEVWYLKIEYFRGHRKYDKWMAVWNLIQFKFWNIIGKLLRFSFQNRLNIIQSYQLHRYPDFLFENFIWKILNIILYIYENVWFGFWIFLHKSSGWSIIRWKIEEILLLDFYLWLEKWTKTTSIIVARFRKITAVHFIKDYFVYRLFKSFKFELIP